MVCYKPLQATFVLREDGKKEIAFSNTLAELHDKDKSAVFKLPNSIQIPCGRCVGCRLEKSRQWAMRCMHEAQLHENNCFVTLTFNNENLPKDRSVDVKVFQNFMKRLRKRFGVGIRFFHCGEYGEVCAYCGKSEYYCNCLKFKPVLGRPHYHVIIFGHDFSDKVLWSNKRGVKLYISAELQKLWPFGFSSIGDVTFKSCAYVARYVMKKINGKPAKDHYRYVDPDSGEIFQRKPEYITMSRRGGIGKDFFNKYVDDIYPDDYIVVNNKKMKPPKYYDNLFESSFPYDFEIIKDIRQRKRQKLVDDRPKEFLKTRLGVKERLKNNSVVKLIRTFTKGD